MDRNKLLSLFLLLIVTFENVKCNEEGFFTIFGSNLIQFKKSYKVSVVYQGYEKEKSLQLGIVAKRGKYSDQPDNKYENYQNITIKGDGVEFVEFDLKNQPEGSFVLEVKSLTGDKFDAMRKLHMNSKKYSTFVQTDKSVYKPADNVQFRVFILDGETKPIDTSNVEIYISDGADNRVKQFDHPKFHKGVFQGELQLSDLPVMGTWHINVKVNGEDALRKGFDVAEYVLPKFEVSIDANPDANFKDGKIRATVKAKYTFGKIAKGNATVTAQIDHGDYFWRRYYIKDEDEKKVSKSVEVDGKKFVEFDIEKELGIEKGRYEQKVKLFATFTEGLSGKEANATAKVTIHETPHKIDLAKSNDKFKPGLPYKITATVRYHDKNAPVTDTKNPIKFNVTYYYDVMRTCKRRRYYPIRPYIVKVKPEDSDGDGDSSTTEKLETTTPEEQKVEEYVCRDEKSFVEEKSLMLEKGTAVLPIEMPSNITHISVKAKYLDTEESIYHISREESESNQFIQVKLLTEKPTVQKEVAIEVLSTADISSITYQIIGKGNLIEAKTVKFPSTKSYVLSFKPKLSMVPKAQLVIYYITADGEIISDNIEVEFENQLTNYIDVHLSKDEAKPGENLNISVKTRPNSFVGLLGVDQSVLLLKKGNDIDHSTVFSELKSYAEPTQYNYEWYNSYDYENRHSDFDVFETVTITNAKKEYERKYIPIYYEYDDSIRPMYAFAARGPGGPVGAPGFALQSAPMPESAAVFKTTTLQANFDRADHAPDFDSDSASGQGSPPRKPIEVRKEFPETWLFDNLEFGENEQTAKIITKKVPDTITSWIITGFSIDPATGLGLTKEPSKFRVFQPFFVSTNLPYSIKRGEVVSIPISVFNYMDTDQQTEVTLFNEDKEFEFVEVNEEENSVHRPKRALEQKRTKNIFIKSNEGSSLSFMIRSLKVGQITIKVTASTPIAGDGVERQLRVEPEGVTKFENKAIFIDLRKDPEFNTNIEITVPSDAVEDSTRIEASAIGDILGPSIENLHNLIKLPYGCGEQNMLNFVPNIVVLDYLTQLNKLTPEIEAKAKKYMETGYQRELSYKHDDGSYSAFGKNDKSGSTWLTAFVARSFNDAAKYIDVDDKIVKEALNFLRKVQSLNGSFVEVGHVSHRGMQGGASKGIALTAYTLITFLENKKYAEDYKDTINRALDYIVNNLDQLNDTYSLAIASYALHKANHELKDSLLAKLDNKADDSNGMKHWEKEGPVTESYYEPSSSINVEMSAYGLQTYIEAGRDGDAVPIMKWLITKRNKNGGFASTQDTIVGLQALSKLAGNIYVPNNDIQVTINSPSSNPFTLKMNAANSLILQKQELPSDARQFAVSAKGKGFTILQISYRYNIDNSGKKPRFVLNPKIEPSSNKEFLHLNVCTNFVPDSEAETSNMAVMEVSLPSGFTFDSDHLPDLLATRKVKKVETKDLETIVIVYFDDIGSEEICPDFKAYRTHGVAKHKPAPIVIYDYYDNSRHARTFYNPPEVSLCDICFNEIECKNACESTEIEIS